MALKINKALNTADGGTIATGAIVRWITQIPETADRIQYFPNIYRTEEGAIAISSPIVEIPIPSYTYTLQEGDELSVLFVETKYKEYFISMPEIGAVVEIV